MVNELKKSGGNEIDFSKVELNVSRDFADFAEIQPKCYSREDSNFKRESTSSKKFTK